MKIDDNFYMDLAIEEAWNFQGLTYPNPAVGGLILDGFGKILAISAHKKAGKPHSEVLVIQNAYYEITKDSQILKLSRSEDIHNYLYKNHKNIFQYSTIFTTLEPCNHFGKTPPCSNLIQKLGFKKVVIGFSDISEKAKGGEYFLQKSGIQTVNLNSENAKNLLEPFLKWNQKNFIFFKYAQTLNGNISDGIISSQESRKLVHKLRDKIDLLVIGGNTVRMDRPTLDSRLVQGKAPDILIFSKQKAFSQDIPLFQIPNRKVQISDNLEILNNYKYIMVEGGFSLLNKIIEKVHFLMIFVSPKLVSNLNVEIQKLDFEIVFSRNIGQDILLYLLVKHEDDERLSSSFSI